MLNAHWILTTASCVGEFQGPLQYFLLAVNARKQSYSIEKIILHESYNNADSENDVALVRLSIPLTFTNGLKPIRLSSELSSIELRAFEWNTKTNIMFLTQDKFLPETLLPVRPKEKLDEIITSPRPRRAGRFIVSTNLDYIEEHKRNPNQLYASSMSSSCSLINGSPLLNAQDNTIAGMASRNVKCITDPQAKVAFVHIPHHYNWIQKNLS